MLHDRSRWLSLALPALALSSLALLASCKRDDAEAKKALQEELKQLKETRLELEATVTKLEPLVVMAEFVNKQGLLAGLDDSDLMEDLDPDLEALLDDSDSDLDAPTDSASQEQDEADAVIRQVLLEQINEIKPLHYSIARDAVDKVLENPMTVARGARIVPSIKDGQANGFKLYAIRPGSLYSALGFMNGDTIHTINGFDLTTPDRALEVYTKVREAKRIDVELTRRGKPLQLRFDIVK